MNHPPYKRHLAQRVVQFHRDGANFEIAYGEDESIDGRLWVEVSGKMLDRTELLALAQKLQQKEKTLADSRSRYKEMAMAFDFLQHPEPGPKLRKVRRMDSKGVSSWLIR